MLNWISRPLILSIMFIMSKNIRLWATTKFSDWVRLRHMNNRLTKISKYLSFILRHHPEKIGLKVDDKRWANVEELVEKANASGKSFTLEQVKEVVAQNEDQIFQFSEDGLCIRCV